ncbi:MAG: DUF2939 domain-containing protein [Rhodospirillales bacterium]|nr:DUF2939 domain-containing protein [Rhodospirillales bacterium]
MQHADTVVVRGSRNVHRRTLVLLILTTLLIGYLAYPYVTLYRLDRALEDHDAGTVAELIDWTAVRERLKADVTSSLAIQAYGSSGAEAVGAAIALALTPYVFDPVTERVVSPSGLIAWYSEARRSGQSSSLWEAISYAFFRTPTRFDVTLRMNDPQYSNIGFEMRLQGMRWRVNRLVWPRIRSIASPGLTSPGPTTE